MRTTCDGYLNYWSKKHRQGKTPYVYHTGADGQRYQHYPATFFWTMVGGDVLGLVAIILCSDRIPLLKDLSHIERQALAGIGLIGMLALSGVVAAILHHQINDYREAKDRSDYSIQLDHRDLEGDEEIELQSTPINETTGLIGQDRGGASIFRIGNHHLLHTIYPPTPIKTALWVPALGLVAFTLANMIQSDLFDQLAESMVGYGLGSVSVFLLLPMILGGIATLSHYSGAKVVECCEMSEEVAPLTTDFSF